MRAARAAMRIAALAAASLLSHAAAASTDFDFGTVRPGTEVAHEFVVRNTAPAAARITSVQLTPPMRLERAPATIPAGGAVTLRVRLDTAQIRGDYRGRFLVALADATEREFSVHGRVQPTVEVLPRPAVFLSTARGAAKSASVEIVGHGEVPLEVSIAKPPAVGEARLEPVERGRRYRLTVSVGAGAAPGRHSDRVMLATSDPAQPSLPVGVNILVRERVHLFPDAVDLGAVRLRDLRAGSGPDALAQTLMVYRDGGRDFRVAPSTELEALHVRAEPGPQGDRVQLTLSIDPRKAAPGKLEGTLVLVTNDPEFPRLEVPVRGLVLPD